MHLWSLEDLFVEELKDLYSAENAATVRSVSTRGPSIHTRNIL